MTDQNEFANIARPALPDPPPFTALREGMPSPYGGERFGHLPCDEIRKTPAGHYARLRLDDITLGKPTITLFVSQMERELALAFAEGHDARESQMREILTSFLALAASMRRNNQDSWMLHFAERMNGILAKIGETARVSYRAEAGGFIIGAGASHVAG